MEKNIFSQRIKDLRIEKKLKQSDVANALGFTNQAISNYEFSKREPRIHDLILLADFFDVSIDYLVGRTDEK